MRNYLLIYYIDLMNPKKDIRFLYRTTIQELLKLFLITIYFHFDPFINYIKFGK